jgi:hypothetical protein
MSLENRVGGEGVQDSNRPHVDPPAAVPSRVLPQNPQPQLVHDHGATKFLA